MMETCQGHVSRGERTMAPVHKLHLHLHMLPDFLSAFVPQQKAIELANAYANAF